MGHLELNDNRWSNPNTDYITIMNLFQGTNVFHLGILYTIQLQESIRDLKQMCGSDMICHSNSET